MRFLALLLLCLPMWSAELPSTAARAVTTYDKEVAKAQAEYEAALKRSKSKLLKVLDSEKTRETKAGRLETALAIKAKIDSLTEGIDILGNPTDTLATIKSALVTEAQAKALGEALQADSITEKDWDKLPGKEYQIPCSGKKLPLPMKKDEVYIIVPNPTDTWENNVSWKGEVGIPNYLGRGGNRRCLIWNIDQKIWGTAGIVTVPANGNMTFQLNTSAAKGTGTLRIKVFKQK